MLTALGQLLLERVKNRVVVVGSYARNEGFDFKDLDLLYDMDSVPARAEVEEAVLATGCQYDSALVGSWSLPSWETGIAIELLPIHNGASYRKARRNATQQEVLGVLLWVARKEDA